MFKFFVISFIAVSAVKAYDLVDSNHYSPVQRDSIKNSYNENSDSKLNKKDSVCCIGDTSDPEYIKHMQEHKKQCDLKLRSNKTNVENFDPFDCKEMMKIKDLIICEQECFSRSTNQIDENGAFNRDAIKLHYSKLAVGGTSWKIAALDGYIDSCLAQASNKHQPPKEQQCSSDALNFHHCIWNKFRSGCPAELRVNSTKCNKMMNQLNEASEQLFHRKLLLKFVA